MLQAKFLSLAARLKGTATQLASAQVDDLDLGSLLQELEPMDPQAPTSKVGIAETFSCVLIVLVVQAETETTCSRLRQGPAWI